MARVVLYRGSAKDVNDPSGQGRVVVEVPALGVNVRLGWAKVYTVPIGLSWAVLPEVGDEVLVTFELGNLTLPVIFPPTAGQLIPGLMLLRGVVVDASDPLGQKRVRVMVPALSEELMPWGPVCTPLTPATARTLALDMKVAVAFQGGDKNYPVVLGRLP